MAEKNFKLLFGADPSEMIAGIAAATESVKEGAATMAESLAKVKEGFSLLAESAVAITGIMAGGKVFGEMISSTVKLNTESLDLGKQLGVSATQASILKVALGETFLTQEQLSGAATRITRTLNTNEAAFKALGVATRDANGDFLPTIDIITKTNEKLLELKEGTDRNVEGVKIYGRGWSEIAPTLRLTTEAIAEAKGTAEALNLVVTDESQTSTLAYRSAMVGLKDTFEGTFNTIGQALLPMLTQLGNWFRDSGPAAIAATRASIATTVEIFYTFKDTVTESVEWIIGQFVTLGLQISTTAQVIWDALHFDFDKMKADNELGLAQERAVYQKYLEDVAADQKRAAAAIAANNETLFGDKSPSKKPTGTETSEGGADKGLMAGYEEELAQLKLKNQQELADGITTHARTLEDDANFWKEKLALGEASGQQEIELRKKVAQASAAAIRESLKVQLESLKIEEAAVAKNAEERLAIARKEAEVIARTYGANSTQYETAQKHITEVLAQQSAEQQRIVEAFEKVEVEAQNKSIENEQRSLQAKYAAREISATQLEAAEEALETKRTQIAQKGITDRINLLASDPNHSPAEMAALDAQLIAEQQRYQTAITEIQQKAAQNQRQLWDQLNKSIEGDFTNAITGMLKGTENFHQGMQKLFKSLLDSIISFIAQWVVKWAAGQLENLLASKTTAVSAVVTQAAVAGASGTASMAGAPWPMDLTAPAFGAEMFAESLSFLGAASAAKGFDVPAGMSPVTNLHPREMVLPEELADVIRGMAAGGGRRGGSAGPILNVNTPDAHSFERMLHSNSAGVQNFLRRLHGANRR